MLDFVLSFKGEPKKVNNRIVEYNLYLIVHNGSNFDIFVVINSLPQRRNVDSLIKNGERSRFCFFKNIQRFCR